MFELAGRFEIFSYLPPNLILNPFIKNVPPVILFWALWFFPNDEIAATRQKLITTLFVAATAIFVGRAIKMVLPFKLRPMYDPTVTQTPVVNVDLSEWSAFSSDHAALFFSLAMCFLLINRFAGILALLHAVFFRLDPTDIAWVPLAFRYSRRSGNWHCRGVDFDGFCGNAV